MVGMGGNNGKDIFIVHMFFPLFHPTMLPFDDCSNHHSQNLVSTTWEAYSPIGELIKFGGAWTSVVTNNIT